MAGKGSRQRPTDTEKYGSNWDRIFGAKKVQVAQGLTPEPGMSTSSLEDYRGQPNAHAEGSEAPNE